MGTPTWPSRTRASASRAKSWIASSRASTRSARAPTTKATSAWASASTSHARSSRATAAESGPSQRRTEGPRSTSSCPWMALPIELVREQLRSLVLVGGDEGADTGAVEVVEAVHPAPGRQRDPVRHAFVRSGRQDDLRFVLARDGLELADQVGAAVRAVVGDDDAAMLHAVDPRLVRHLLVVDAPGGRVGPVGTRGRRVRGVRRMRLARVDVVAALLGVLRALGGRGAGRPEQRPGGQQAGGDHKHGDHAVDQVLLRARAASGRCLALPLGLAPLLALLAPRWSRLGSHRSFPLWRR